jgi:voltage-dependent anion channel protein 2
MPPPTYGDLGKSARNIFGTGFHFGLLKIDVKTKTKSGVEFSAGQVSNQDTGRVFGTLESKYKVKEYGLTFVEKWNTDNILGFDVTLADKPLKGLTLGYSSTFSPQTGLVRAFLFFSYQ